jgi:hypothetical protein
MEFSEAISKSALAIQRFVGRPIIRLSITTLALRTIRTIFAVNTRVDSIIRDAGIGKEKALLPGLA